jgi:hypothetical protein
MSESYNKKKNVVFGWINEETNKLNHMTVNLDFYNTSAEEAGWTELQYRTRLAGFLEGVRFILCHYNCSSRSSEISDEVWDSIQQALFNYLSAQQKNQDQDQEEHDQLNQQHL